MADTTPPAAVFVSGVAGHGGPNASLRSIVSRLPHVDRILVGPYGAQETERWRGEGVRVERIPRPVGLRARMAAIWKTLRICWRLRERRPLLFANGLTEVAILVPVLLLLRLPTFVWIHNSVPPRIALALSPILRMHHPRRLRLAAVSRMAGGIGREVFGPGSDIAVLPNPIDPKFSVVERKPATGSRLRISYLAGTDRPHKGFDLLPEIIAALGDLPLDWQIVAVEAKQPEAWRRLREVIERLESSTVGVRGRTDRVEELYRATDVVLIPSRMESFCRVAAEAMASGAMVVAARLPAIEEVCGDVAHYFDPEDCFQAAAILRRLYSSRSELEADASRGRTRATRFRTDAVMKQLVALVPELAPTEPGPATQPGGSTTPPSHSSSRL